MGTRIDGYTGLPITDIEYLAQLLEKVLEKLQAIEERLKNLEPSE